MRFAWHYMLHVLHGNTHRLVLQETTFYDVMCDITIVISVPGGPPRGVTAEALNATAILVRWRPITAHLSNGNVLGYQIAYVISDSLAPRSEIVNAYEGELQKLPIGQILVSCDWLIELVSIFRKSLL